MKRRGLTDALCVPCSHQVNTLTKLDSSELHQLLQLFYEVRKDSDVAVDTDVNPVPEDVPRVKKAANGETPEAFCRKCRRAKSKCICETRAQAPKQEELSTVALATMLHDALVLREEYDELMEQIE